MKRKLSGRSGRVRRAPGLRVRRAPRRAGQGPMERSAHVILAEAGRVLARLAPRTTRAVAAAAETMLGCFQNGGTIYFCGNGGSAADAQHLAAELSGRFFLDRSPLPAVALTTNSSALTAIGNDYGFADTFARQLEGLGCPGDVLVAITTSGGSANVKRAVDVAHRLGMTVIGLTGSRGAAFAARCDLALVTPSDSTPRIQEGHIVMGHTLCELVERGLFGAGAPRADVRPAGRRALPATARRGRSRRSKRT